MSSERILGTATRRFGARGDPRDHVGGVSCHRGFVAHAAKSGFVQLVPTAPASRRGGCCRIWGEVFLFWSGM